MKLIGAVVAQYTPCLSLLLQHHALGCGSSASLVETVSTSAFVQLAASYRGADIACPRCSAVIPASTLNRLPLHKKICSLVRMLNKFRTNASLLSFHSGEDAVVRVEEGHPVYEGVWRTSFLSMSSYAAPGYSLSCVCAISLAPTSAGECLLEVLLNTTQLCCAAPLY